MKGALEEIKFYEEILVMLRDLMTEEKEGSRADRCLEMKEC